MNSVFDIKKFILEKTVNYIQEMPLNVYALYYFINAKEGSAKVPTLSLMYNTLGEIGKVGIEPVEACWNIAFWETGEFPIIGNNEKTTSESKRTRKMLSEWFSTNGYNSLEIESDPFDDSFEHTVGYRVLSEVIEEIAPEVKKAAKDHFQRDVVLLLGEYSYMPMDYQRITAMNGVEANAFIEYYEKMEESNDFVDPSMIEGRECEDYGKIFSEFIEKIKEKYKS